MSTLLHIHYHFYEQFLGKRTFGAQRTAPSDTVEWSNIGADVSRPSRSLQSFRSALLLSDYLSLLFGARWCGRIEDPMRSLRVATVIRKAFDDEAFAKFTLSDYPNQNVANLYAARTSSRHSGDSPIEFPKPQLEHVDERARYFDEFLDTIIPIWQSEPLQRTLFMLHALAERASSKEQLDWALEYVAKDIVQKFADATLDTPTFGLVHREAVPNEVLGISEDYGPSDKEDVVQIDSLFEGTQALLDLFEGLEGLFRQLEDSGLADQKSKFFDHFPCLFSSSSDVLCTYLNAWLTCLERWQDGVIGGLPDDTRISSDFAQDNYGSPEMTLRGAVNASKASFDELRKIIWYLVDPDFYAPPNVHFG